jgi:AmmeMemoRadiSam system protein A
VILLPAEARAFLRRYALARAIAAIQGRAAPPPPAPAPAEVRVSRGLFVTVTVSEELRGCLGTVRGDGELLMAAGRFAAEAVTLDPRFRPVHEAELPRLHLEISVLTPPAVVADHALVEAGRHGVVVRHADRVGVLLPQVARRHGWDGPTLVRQAAQKAQIPEGDHAAASVEVFEAETF